MPKEPLKDRLKKLTELKERFLRDANIEAGRTLMDRSGFLRNLLRRRKVEQELPNPVQTPKRRGRPPRVAEPPEVPVEHKAPVAVTVSFKAGAVDTFGCVGWKISGPFFIF